MLQRAEMKALTMTFVPPDTCLKDYKKRRNSFLNELIASTPNVSTRAKEFRRWIYENSPYNDNDVNVAAIQMRAKPFGTRCGEMVE